LDPRAREITKSEKRAKQAKSHQSNGNPEEWAAQRSRNHKCAGKWRGKKKTQESS